MKFSKEWMLGGNKRNEELDDYISAYVSDTGIRIECQHGFYNWNEKWYEIDGHHFEKLKDAKKFVENVYNK